MQNVSSILLTIIAIAVVIDGAKGNAAGGVVRRTESGWIPVSVRNQTRDERYHRERYGDYRSGKLQTKYKRPTLSNNEWRPHFPAPAHSYLSPINNPPSNFNSYTPVYPQTPYSPPQSQSYERPASIYPTAYYTKSTNYAYRKPSYSSPSYFPPAHNDVPHFSSAEPHYPSLYYNDFKREPESYSRPSVGYTNKPNDFPDFEEFLRQSIAFQHFRP